MFRQLIGAAVIGAIGLSFFGAEPATAAGYWNVPSSFPQWAGFGCGGGYHAPLVLGPMSCRGWFAHNHYRLPYSPAPNYGCSHCGGGFEQPTIMEPAPQPTVAPPAPSARMRRPLFLR